MAETNSAHRQPPSTPYAALHATADKDGQPRGDGPIPKAEPDYLTIEADRLEEIKQALYAAFLAAPKAGIPTGLVDFAATYTSALRLQMSLKGYSGVQARSVKAPMFSPRTK